MTERELPKKSVYTFWVIALIPAILAFIVFLPALGNGFLNWDDPVYAYDNPYIQSLDLEFFKWVSTAVVSGNWHPLTMVSHAIDYTLFGANPAGHHFINIMLHAINTLLVFLLISKLMAAPGKRGLACEWGKTFATIVAFSTAVLFAIHPIHVESVAWVSERKDLLCALFFLLSLVSYLSFISKKKGTRSLYALSILFAVLALLSKPMAVSLPLVLLIIDYYPLKRFTGIRGGLKGAGKVLIEKIPFFLASIVFALITLFTQKGTGLSSVGSVSIVENILSAFRAYIFYLFKFALPLDLSPLYPSPLWQLFPNNKLLAVLIAVIIVTVVAIIASKNYRLIFSLWAYFIITLIPVVGIVSVGSQGAADRYTYLPGISLCLFFGFIFAGLYRRAGRNSFMGALVVVVVLLSYLTLKQIPVWNNPISFWSKAIETQPHNLPLAYINRAMAYEDMGDYSKAIEDYSAAIQQKPGHASTYNNRGNILNTLGRYREAIKDFNTAIKIDPTHSYAYNNRGISYARLGAFQLAINDYLKTIELEPGLAAPYKNLGDAYMNLGDSTRAKEAYKRASEADYR